MVARRQMLRLLLFLSLTLALVGCGSLPSPADPPAAAPDERPHGDAQASPLAQVSPLPTPRSAPAREPLDLVVLHTNDNWGETEPCG